MKAIAKATMLVMCLIYLGACSKTETGTLNVEEQSEIANDSMPTVEPELPETTNVVEPIITDSMPVADPENIKKQ